MRSFSTFLLLAGSLWIQWSGDSLNSIKPDHPVPPPVGLSPVSGTTIMDSITHFVWTRSSDSVTYEMLLANNIDFSETTCIKTTDTAVTIFIKDSTGILYWKVRAWKDEKTSSEWSPVYLFYPRKPVKYEFKAPCGRIGGCAGCMAPCGRRQNYPIDPLSN